PDNQDTLPYDGDAVAGMVIKPPEVVDLSDDEPVSKDPSGDLPDGRVSADVDDIPVQEAVVMQESGQLGEVALALPCPDARVSADVADIPVQEAVVMQEGGQLGEVALALPCPDAAAVAIEGHVEDAKGSSDGAKEMQSADTEGPVATQSMHSEGPVATEATDLDDFGLPPLKKRVKGQVYARLKSYLHEVVVSKQHQDEMQKALKESKEDEPRKHVPVDGSEPSSSKKDKEEEAAKAKALGVAAEGVEPIVDQGPKPKARAKAKAKAKANKAVPAENVEPMSAMAADNEVAPVVADPGPKPKARAKAKAKANVPAENEEPISAMVADNAEVAPVVADPAPQPKARAKAKGKAKARRVADEAADPPVKRRRISSIRKKHPELAKMPLFEYVEMSVYWTRCAVGLKLKQGELEKKQVIYVSNKSLSMQDNIDCAIDMATILEVAHGDWPSVKDLLEEKKRVFLLRHM
ncbi:unnamed protein product, partial [Symbiodinium sp. CCMP2592]